MARKIDERTNIDFSFGSNPMMVPENSQQSGRNTVPHAKLAELQHEAPAIELSAESVKNFLFAALFDNHVQVVGPDDTAPEELGNSRHHPGVLGCPFRERHESDEFLSIARRQDR